MKIVRVMSPGLSTFQDAGRHGYVHLGVPTAGALDGEAYQLLCRLLDVAHAPCVELLDGDLVIRPEGGDIEFAVISGSCTVVNGEEMLPSGTVCLLKDGQELSIRRSGPGPAYLGISGLAVEPVLGSVSFDTLSRLGPSPLFAGQGLAIDARSRNRVGAFLKPSHDRLLPGRGIKVVPAEHFTAGFDEVSWTVTSVSRSGVRLAPSKELDEWGPADLASMPVQPGSIQLPSRNEAIILGPDSGVTGGYPVAASVIMVDLPKIARLAVGNVVSFHPAAISEAAELWQATGRKISTSVVNF